MEETVRVSNEARWPHVGHGSTERFRAFRPKNTRRSVVVPPVQTLQPY